MSNTITLTKRQHENLIKKSKTGFALYYEECNVRNNENIEYCKIIKELKNKLEEISNESEIPLFLTNEINELHKSLKKKIECPICLEEISNLKISRCGHKTCNDCYIKIDKCAICRKPIYHKKN